MDKSTITGKEIIVVTVEMGVGGAERVLSQLIDQWIKFGNHVTLIQTRPNYYGHSYDLNPLINQVNIQAKGKNKITRYLGETISLFKYLKKHPDATVVAFANASIRIVGVCSHFVKNRIVFSERCDPRNSPGTELMRKLRYRLFELADQCVFQTQEAMNCFSKKAQSKGVVISNPVNQKIIEPWEGEKRKVIVTACRLSPQKNLSLLIKACSRVFANHPDYSLEIYGSGDEKSKLEKLINCLQMENHIKLMGHTSCLHQVMRDCSMYVCSSDYEGISNSMLEAMALGLPVISTDCPVGGARETISDGENGMLIPVGDEDAMFGAIQKIIENPSIGIKMGIKAQNVRIDYDLENIAYKWLELF